MTLTDQNITMWQGETKTITANLVNEAGSAYGSLSGLTFSWKLTESETSSTALVSKTPTGTTDNISFTLVDEDTEGLAPGTYYHECRVVDGSGNEDVIFTGGIILKGSTTNT